MDRFVIKTPRQSTGTVVSTPSGSINNGKSLTGTGKTNKEERIFTKPPSDLGQDTPKQPRNCDFPYSSDGRRFNVDWYNRFEWLEYSVSRGAAFCYPCRKYACGSMTENENRKTFTVSGFCNWKRAVGDKEKGLVQHDTSKNHENAMVDWKSRLTRVETNKSVSLMLSSEVLEKRRYYVKSLSEIVQFLAINELAFRGSYNITEHEEQGLFNKLFNYTLRKDSKLAEISKGIPKNATLKSPEVQNGIISLMAQMVSESIANDVRLSETGRFTVLADGTRNKSNVENIACALRYTINGTPKESLLVIKSTEELNAEALSDVIIGALEEYEIDTSKMLSQCYDGASCMSGNRGGVQRLIQNRLGRQIPYVHCKNHRLHLVVIDLVCGIVELNQFFDELSLVYNYFSKFKVDQSYHGTSLKRVLDTRWSGHYDSTVAVVDNFSDILSALDEISQNQKGCFDAETVATSIGLLSMMTSERFMFLAVTMKRILGILKPADAALQKRETDINESIKVIDASVSILKSLRSESGFEEIKETLKTLNDVAAEHKPEQGAVGSRPKRKRTVNQRLDNYFVTEDLSMTLGEDEQTSQLDRHKRLFFEVIDKVLCEMKIRFTDNGWLYSAVRAMSRDSPKFLDGETLKPLSKLNLDIPSDAELEVAKQFLKSVPLAQSQDSNLVLGNLNEQKTAFPKLYKLASDIAAIGSSSAVCESGFSVLTRIDKPTRRAMLQPRQANLVLLAFENKRTSEIDLDVLIRRLAILHPRLQLI